MAVVSGMTKNGSARAFGPPTGDKAFDDWVAPQRTAAIARILKEVRKPSNGEIQLATDIYETYIEMRVKFGHEDSKATNRLKMVRRILGGLEKLTSLINADPYIRERVGQSLGVQPQPIVHLYFQSLRLENELVTAVKCWRSKKADLPKLRGRRPSELEWLAGVSLPLVYERHFRSRSGRSRSAKGEPGGPTVRFIEATLTELGLPYSPESIVRAFTRMAPLRKPPPWQEKEEK